MNKKLFLIVIPFLFAVTLPAQKVTTVVVNYATNDGTASNSNIIYYEPDQALHWDDFKGKPTTAGDEAALTTAGFGLKLNFRGGQNTSELVISVSCSFSKKDSWVKPGNKTSYILNHEQKHFDIAYIYTLLFIQNLKNAHLTITNYDAIIEKIYNETATLMSKVQDQYDAETAHSMLPEKQAAWDEKINKLLAVSGKK